MAHIDVVSSIAEDDRLQSLLFKDTGAGNGSPHWIKECFISMSPYENAIVIGSPTAVVTLSTPTSGSSCESPTYNIQSSLNFDTEEDSDRVTTVHCFPLESSKSKRVLVSDTGVRHRRRAGDRKSCIVIGFASGFVRIYSMKGALLVAQMLHSGPIVRLRQQPGSGVNDFAVLYSKVLAVLDGHSLLLCLRACLARAERNEQIDDAPAISFRKWSIEGREETNDVVCRGLTVLCPYDQMVQSQSMSANEPGQQYIVGGYHPMIAAYSSAGCDRPMFSAAALANTVANKLSEAVFSMVTSLWGSHKNAPKKEESEDQDKPAAALEPSSPLPMTVSLNDPRRHVQSLSLGPWGDIAVACDAYGRVMLLDVDQMTIVRMWKGYRDVQCGWIESIEEGVNETSTDDEDEADTTSQEPRRCVFLVIFLPRRGIIEIWSVRHGPRVAAFNVEENMQLVSLPGVGGSESTLQQLQNPLNRHRCFLLDGNGQLHSINAPFYASISDSLSSRSKDKHRLKSLQELLATGKASEEDIMSLVSQIESPASVREVAGLIDSAKQPEQVIVNSTNALVALVESTKDDSPSDPDAVDAEMFVKVRNSMVHAHRSLKALHPENPGSTPSIKTSSKDLSIGIFRLPTDDAERIKTVFTKILDLEPDHPDLHYQSLSQAATQYPLDVFLNAFDTEERYFSTQPISENILSFLKLEPSLADDEKQSLAFFLFNSIVSGQLSVDLFRSGLSASCLTIPDAIKLLYIWMTAIPVRTLLHSRVLETCNAVLCELVRSIRQNAKPDDQASLWADVVSICDSSTHTTHAHVFILLAHSVATAGGHNDNCTPVDWNLCLNRFEDVAALNQATAVGNASSVPVNNEYSVTLLRSRMTATIVSIVVNFGVAPLQIVDQGEEKTSVVAVLRERFPAICDPDVLLGLCAVDAAKRWNANPSLVDSLASAAEYLAFIKHPAITSAVALFIWTVLLKKKFAALVSLIEKIGKFPKQRLCIKHLQLESEPLAQVVHATHLVLVSLASAAANTTAPPTPTLVDERWCDPSDTPVGSLEICLAEYGGNADVDIVNLHVTLATLVEFILAYEMKSIRPYNLFTEKQTAALFSPFVRKANDDTSQLKFETVTDEVQVARRDFIARCVAHAVAVETTPTDGPRKPPLSAVYTLSTSLKVDQQFLLARHAINLMQSGRDGEVEEIVVSLSDTSQLAAPFLEVARLRTALIVSSDNTETSINYASKLPTLYDWIIKAKKPPLDQCPIVATTLKQTIGLVRRILSLNNAEVSQQAQLLLDALSRL